jgi:hypothetical protein
MTNGPKFHAYTVKDRAGKKPVWTKIGSAWSHAQGGGFNIELQALPMDGRIVLMPPPAEEVSRAVDTMKIVDDMRREKR